jgi:hypothetical protein
MKRALISKNQSGIYYIVDGKKVYGSPADLRGDVGGLSGNVSRLSGEVSGLSGNVSGLRGDVDLCEITESDRANGVSIIDLVVNR